MSIENFNILYQTFVEKIPNYINNLDKLKEYITFCLENNTNVKIKGVTSYHHILPQCRKLPFSDYTLLNKYTWNGAHLTYYNHYYAHFLLYQAVTHPSILFSFVAMHKKDFSLGRITEKELIPEYIFNEIMKQRNENISKDKLELVFHNGEFITKAKRASLIRNITDAQKQKMSIRMKGDNNIVYSEGIVDKIRKTKLNTFIDGKNLDTISAERAAATMSKEFIDEQNNMTTIYKQNGKKLSDYYKTLVILPDGTTTTIGKLRSSKTIEIIRSKSKMYILKNIFNDSYCEYLPAYELRKISPGLHTKTKEDYLGKSKYGINRLIKTNRSHLIGLYVEEL